MKRSGNILLVLLLSLMVVYLSVGTTVMHCLRYDTVKIGAPMADCCQKKDQHCCGFNKNCMEYKQVKLSPTMVFQEVEFDATPLFAGVMPCCWSKLPRPLLANALSDDYRSMDVPHSSPRSYLAFIRVLQI